ncbi:MAG TPA: type II CAAX endopeptidase family protein [Candidatus Limnocylindrales bacterium]|nr:type II CAAX endopeptidase family protein [Candidatus Limnocylindrales bacterium]
MSASRRVSTEPADLVRAGVPLLLLVGAVALPSLAGLFLLGLVGGVAVAAGRRVPVAWAWAAMVPAAIIATLRAFGPAASAWASPACSGVLDAPVPWVVAETALVVAATVGLAGVLGAKGGDLAVRRPPKYAIRWAAMGAAVILAGGLAGVILLARPLFGLPDVQLGGLGFVLPSVVFAVSVAVTEELAWRGAMQGWLAKTLGPWIAVLLQSAVFGVAWGVLLGSPLVGVLAGAAGMVLGATVVRTRSLVVALAWHAAFNVPLFAFLACRAA